MPEDKSKNPNDPYHTEQPPLSTYPKDAIRNNIKGNDLNQEVIERMKVREICEGWGVYRDAAEYGITIPKTTMSDAHMISQMGELSLNVLRRCLHCNQLEAGQYRRIIEASKAGFEKGSKFMYILHRIMGSQVDMNPDLTRAVCKMKIPITCRFTFDDIEMDNDADCRFFFFLEKRGNIWGLS
ncbi:hypothetical protein KCU99_g1512, partial [Aureobasidium melanogenum]